MSGPRTYRTLAAGRAAEADLEVKRSRFRAVVQRADDEDEARRVVAGTRRTHHDAGHHCSAFVLGPQATVRRSSDDGEPSGTAGMPMLDVLTGAGLSDVVAVVSRWFGGTLLGTGGLTRAYGGTVARALESATIITRVQLVRSELTLPHAAAGRVEAGLRARGIDVIDVTYGAEATLCLATETFDAAAQAVAAVTSGDASPRPVGTSWVDR